MKVIKHLGFVCIIIFLLCGCGMTKEVESNKSESTSVNETLRENKSINNIQEDEEKDTELEINRVESDMKKNVDGETELYKVMQNVVDGWNQNVFTIPESFGNTVYTQEDFEEIKQYEMNMVLDYLELQQWRRPTASFDEIDLPVDEPLGEYSSDKLKEYTNEEHEIKIEYYCGGCNVSIPEKRYIAAILFEYRDEIISNLNYCAITYGYLNKMTREFEYIYNFNTSISIQSVKINKIKQGDVNSHINFWIEEDEFNFIYDVGKETRNGLYGEYLSYEQSLWVTCEKEGEQYIITEIIPMQRQ